MVLETILKSWITWACGLVFALLAAFGKKIKEKIDHVRELRKAEKDNGMKNNIVEAVKPLLEEFMEHSDSNDAELYTEISQLSSQVSVLNNQVEIVTEGVLNVQGVAFKRKCRELLNQQTPITEEQYETLMNDHTTYNKLGGNHEGDQLFKLVSAKYEGQLIRK